MGSIHHSMFWMRAFFKSKQFASGFFALASAMVFLFMVQHTNIVCIVEDGVAQYQVTTAVTKEQLLLEQGVELQEQDEVTFTGFKNQYAELVIDRAFAISVVADGVEKEIFVTDSTVGEALSEAGVSISEHDIINLSAETSVEKGDTLVIQRVDFDTRVETTEVPSETIETPSNLLLVGTKKVVSEGSPGSLETVMQDKYVDGQLVETTVMEAKLIAEPVHTLVMTGAQTPSVPAQPAAGIEFDENGLPLNYTAVLTDQKATAYTAPPGSRTSTGKAVGVGLVAVNPKVIPYGSRLYIVTSDGKMVYGYAVAADTGGALMSGAADVDLFYNTEEECIRFGRRRVTIYVLP